MDQAKPSRVCRRNESESPAGHAGQEPHTRLRQPIKTGDLLHASEPQYRATLDAMRDAIHVVDRDLRVVLMNEKLRKWSEELGFDIGDVAGRAIFELYPLLPEKVRDEYATVFNEGKVVNTEESQDVGGREIVTETRKLPIIESGKVTKVVTIIRDITERRKTAEVLRQSEERFRKFFQNGLDYCYMVSDEGVLLDINKAALEALGYERNELVGQPLGRIYASESLPDVKNLFERWRRGEEIHNEELTIRTKDGTRREVLLSAGTIKDERGKLLCSVSVQHDITDRKNAEDAIGRSEEQYRRLVDTCPHGIQEADRDGRIVFANKACHQIFGYQDGELIGKRVWDLPASDGERQQLRELIWRLVEERPKPCAYIGRSLTKDGRVIDIQVDWDYILDVDGRVEGFTSIVTDVTKRRTAERALQESEGKYRQLFETETDAIVIFDAEMLRFIDVNDAAVRLYGYSRDEFLGLSLHDISAEPEASETAVKHSDGISPVRIPLRCHKKKDGTVFPVEISGSSFVLNGRKVMFGVISDITDRKRVEDALRRSVDLLRESQKVAQMGHYMFDVEAERWESSEILDAIFGIDEDYPRSAAGWLQIVHPDQRDEMGAYLSEDVLENHQPFDREYKIVRVSDGQVRWVHGTGRLEFDTQGEPVRMIGTVQDVTERKETEQELEREHRMRETLLDNLPCIAMILKKQSREIVACNKVARSVGAMRGETCYGTCGERDDPCPFCLAPEVWLTNEPRRLEVEHGGKHYEGFWLPWTEDLYVHYIFDISDRKEADRKILENQQQLRSLASQLSRIEERERHRLATSLHDEIAQSLVFSKLKLDELRVSGAGGELAGGLEEVCASLEKVIQETRTLTFDLSSPILYELGFEAAVAEWLADEIEGRHGIETEFCDDGRSKPLDDDIRALLFRNVRELLINIVKHARAHRIKVDVRRTGADICVCVEDDGIGFDPAVAKEMAAKRNKFGLFSIRERLEQLGGLIEIDSGPDRGSRIRMTAPLKCETLTDGMDL